MKRKCGKDRALARTQQTGPKARLSRTLPAQDITYEQSSGYRLWRRRKDLNVRDRAPVAAASLHSLWRKTEVRRRRGVSCGARHDESRHFITPEAPPPPQQQQQQRRRRRRPPQP